MFEREFEGVPPELRRLVEPQIEAAIRDAVTVIRSVPTPPEMNLILLTCVSRVSSAMLLLSAVRRSTSKVPEPSPKEE